MIFREVARAGSISGAARSLGWTQPAVSQHLRALERSCGTALLIRHAGGVDLTPPGQALLARADAVALQLRLAEDELAQLADLRGGRVRLTAYPTAAATLVPAAVARLRTAHPDLEIELTEAEPPEAIAAVSAGDADLALVFSYDGQPPQDAGGLHWTRLGSEAVALVLPTGHALATRARPALADLAEDPWIVGCPRCRAHTMALCAQAGFEPRVRHVTDDYVVIQNLVAAGLGVTLLPSSALEVYRHEGVTVREARGFGRRTFGVVFRPGAERVPATAALLGGLAAG